MAHHPADKQTDTSRKVRIVWRSPFSLDEPHRAVREAALTESRSRPETDWKQMFTEKFWDLYAEVAERHKKADQPINVSEKHTARVAVLKDIRQLCADRGYGEINPPRYATEGDNTSDILLAINTFNRGEFQLRLAENDLSVMFRINAYRLEDITRDLLKMVHDLTIELRHQGIGCPVYVETNDLLYLIKGPRPNPSPNTPETELDLAVYAIVKATGIPPSGRVVAYCENESNARDTLYRIGMGSDISASIPTNPHATTGYFVVEYPNFFGEHGVGTKRTTRYDYGEVGQSTQHMAASRDR